MMQSDWYSPSHRLVPLHLEEAIERSRFGLAGLVFSAAIGLATLSGMAIGIASPAPAREPPPIAMHSQPADECTMAELACSYGFDMPSAAPPTGLRAQLAPAR